MNPYFENLKAHIKANPPNFGDGESVLTMLYECYNENNPYDNREAAPSTWLGGAFF